MRDDYTRQMILETLVSDLQAQVTKLTCENKDLYRTNKILLAQVQDLQYNQVNHDKLVEDLKRYVDDLKDEKLEMTREIRLLKEELDEIKGK